MKRKNNNKKGFTIVELVIVIAVIAILAAVLIPTFSNIIRKAHISSDTQLIRNLNTALVTDKVSNGDHNTMHDALEATKASGYDVGKINASATDNEILWDSKNDVFCYFNKDNGIEYIPETTRTVSDLKDEDYWVISKTINGKYSTYLYETELTTINELTTGLDVGNETTITSISYVNATQPGKSVVIRTNGGTLTVNAPLDTVKHYGNADKVDVQAIYSASYHENGTVKLIAVKEGHVKLEGEAEVNGIYVYNNSQGETKDTSFAEIKITVDNGVDIPKFSRSAVEVQPEGTKVCTVVTDQAKDIYLFNEGIYEQIKTVDADKNVASDASATWADNSAKNTANTQTAAQQLANEFNGTYDAETGKIADKEVTVGETEYTVKFNEQTRTFETYQGEEKVTDTIVVEAVAEVADVASDSGKTADEAEKASALKGTGTKDDPFMIYDYETMQKISDFYSVGYYYFEVAIEKTNNGKIDCLNNWIPVNLNGSFDGKGVTFINLDSTLFDIAWNSSLGNFTIKNAVVRQSSGAIVLFESHRSTIHDVNVEGGYVEGSDRCAIFVGWGDATDNNFIEIKNCYSNATIVSGTDISAAFVGHPYSDNGTHETTVIIDNCYYTGKIYNTADTSPYFVAQSDNTVKVYLRNMSALESYYAVSGVNGMSSFSSNNIHTDDNNETYYCQTNYSVKYTGEHGKITVKSLSCAQNQGELVSISGTNVSSSAAYAKIEFLIAPNAAATESGSYQSVYVLEENVEVVNGVISASKIYNCAIQINGTATTKTGYNSSNTIFNIVNTNYGKTHNGATVKFTEYDINGNIVQIVNVSIASSNAVGVMYNGKSIKAAAVGLDYEYETNLDLTNYDVKVVFVDRDASWGYNFNYYAEFNGTNVSDNTIPASKYTTSSTFEVVGSKIIIHNIERKADRYNYGSLRYGIIVTEKAS